MSRHPLSEGRPLLAVSGSSRAWPAWVSSHALWIVGGSVPLRGYGEDFGFLERSVQLRGPESGTGLLESSPRAGDSTSVLTVLGSRGTGSVSSTILTIRKCLAGT